MASVQVWFRTNHRKKLHSGWNIQATKITKLIVVVNPSDYVQELNGRQTHRDCWTWLLQPGSGRDDQRGLQSQTTKCLRGQVSPASPRLTVSLHTWTGEGARHNQVQVNMVFPSQSLNTSLNVQKLCETKAEIARFLLNSHLLPEAASHTEICSSAGGQCSGASRQKMYSHTFAEVAKSGGETVKTGRARHREHSCTLLDGSAARGAPKVQEMFPSLRQATNSSFTSCRKPGPAQSLIRESLCSH